MLPSIMREHTSGDSIAPLWDLTFLGELCTINFIDAPVRTLYFCSTLFAHFVLTLNFFFVFRACSEDDIVWSVNRANSQLEIFDITTELSSVTCERENKPPYTAGAMLIVCCWTLSDWPRSGVCVLQEAEAQLS